MADNEQTPLDAWAEARAEIAANHLVGENMQRLFEQSIGNIAALKALEGVSADDIDAVVAAAKN